MTAVKFVTLWCDHEGCDDCLDTPCRSNAEARKWSKEWRYVNGRDLCPEHQGEQP